jgi:AbrB family looped-hinge helix DNA binding protein
MDSYYSDMKSVVGERGQVTIPKALRESLGLRPGAELDFQEEGGRLVASRIVRVDPLDKLVGVLPPMDVGKALEELRGPAWRADLDQKRRGNRAR